MSYARKGPESAVYVFTDGERIHCHECSLHGGVTRSAPTPGDMLYHLLEHRASGQAVPEPALTRLRDECAPSPSPEQWRESQRGAQFPDDRDRVDGAPIQPGDLRGIRFVKGKP